MQYAIVIFIVVSVCVFYELKIAAPERELMDEATKYTDNMKWVNELIKRIPENEIENS